MYFQKTVSYSLLVFSSSSQNTLPQSLLDIEDYQNREVWRKLAKTSLLEMLLFNVKSYFCLKNTLPYKGEKACLSCCFTQLGLVWCTKVSIIQMGQVKL